MDKRDIARNVHIKRKKLCNFVININGKTYKGHSQLGQDKWAIEEIFKGQRGGYFVEIGAADGELFSNTYLLEKEFGWTGICIEPDDQYFPVLQKTRDCICENVPLLDQQVEVDFLEIGVLGGIPQHYNTNKVRPKIPTVKKMATTLLNVLQKHNAPKTIDFLSLDTEGSEYLIMKDFPFDEYTIRALVVEHNNVVHQRSALRKLFTHNGFVLNRQVKHDDYWVHSSIADDLQ